MFTRWRPPKTGRPPTRERGALWLSASFNYTRRHSAGSLGKNFLKLSEVKRKSIRGRKKLCVASSASRKNADLRLAIRRSQRSIFPLDVFAGAMSGTTAHGIFSRWSPAEYVLFRSVLLPKCKKYFSGRVTILLRQIRRALVRQRLQVVLFWMPGQSRPARKPCAISRAIFPLPRQ